MFRCRSTQSGAVRSEPYAHKNCYLDLYGYNVKTKQPPTKPLIWMGSSKKDLRALPADVVDVFGYALYVAQTGKRHDNTKVLKGFGGGSVLEVIESHAGNAYRAVYTVRFAAAVVVLHVFQKKSKSGIETPKPDMDLIDARLKKATELMKESKT
jgi:phage-related protein